jgi:YD repeat-containing protein
MDLGALKTRDQVHEKLGEPVATGTDHDQPFEEFHTRRKLCDQNGSAVCMMGFGISLGLSELIAFPAELYLWGRNSFVGQRVRFTYDLDGVTVSQSWADSLTSFNPEGSVVQKDSPRREDANPQSNADRPGVFIRQASEPRTKLD